MREVHFIEKADEAVELLKPVRIDMLTRLGKPSTCPQLARQMNLTTQKVNYHIKVLKNAGLVRLVEERRNRGMLEGVYQAVAKSFWFSPRLVSHLGSEEESRDQASLAHLLQLAEQLQIDVGHLAERTGIDRIPSLGLSAQIQLKNSADRSAFMEELTELFQGLARKYGSRQLDDDTNEGDGFKLMLACYPQQTNDNFDDQLEGE
jgi:predicted ArsR family transcriptional regulator